MTLNSATRLILILFFCLPTATLDPTPTPPSNIPASPFIASIDTMKESRDTATKPLTPDQIAADVNLAASLNTNTITVDTYWDYPDYVAQWIAAVRKTGRHIWFRGHPEGWSSAAQMMTPAQYRLLLESFIRQHPTFFEPGDIFDPCPEPENGNYWRLAYGDGWTWKNAPNAATREYNAFIRDTTATADRALAALGITGVVTTIRSVNAFMALHVLEPETVTLLGRITLDSYVDSRIIDPAAAARARLEELGTLENQWHVPIILGEIGYSNSIPVDDATQHRVLSAELDALVHLSYLSGVNYWVGAGTDHSGGYTHIFAGKVGDWTPRPGAEDLAAFYAQMTISQ